VSAAAALGNAANRITVTRGPSRTATTWADRWTGTWPDLAALLTTHATGPKDGPCIVPALLREPTRQKAHADRIDVAFLDSDTGAPLSEIGAALEARGWAGAVSSTHSHLSTRTEAKKSHWDRFFQASPSATAADFLRQEKHYVEAVTAGAAAIETDENLVVIEHRPCPKFRVVLPLARPWLAAAYTTQAEANAAWKERIEALAGALGLDHDQSCVDTSRLFYLPRRSVDGPAPETAIVAGDRCDIFALPPGKVAAPDIFTASAGQPASAPRQDNAPTEYVDPVTGEVIRLATWAREYGSRFLIAKALRALKPEVLTGLVADGTKVHCDCPNGDAHTSPARDSATYMVDAGRSETKGFVCHCRHAHCSGLDRTFFVAQMLRQGWLTPADLTDPRFLLAEAEQPAGDWTADAPPPDQEPEVEEAARPDPAEAPAPVFDPWDIPAPPRFPIAALPDVLRAFAEDRARTIGADPAAIAWSAISACSAAIDGRIRLRMKTHDGWTVPPAIWVALVGRPSSKKSPVIDAAWEPLHHAQGVDLRRWREAHDQWKALPKDEQRNTPEPVPSRRLVTHDATMEATQEILGRQDRGIGVLRDELAGWIGSLEKYSSGRGSAADRAFWLQAHNGTPHVVDRVGRGTTAVNNLLATICGGIQPDRLRQFGDLTDDGLWQRFVPILVGPGRMGCDERPTRAATDYAAAVDWLLQLDPKMRMELSAAAQAIRLDVEKRAFELEQGEALGARFASFCGKMHGLWGRLALVLTLLDPEPGAPFIVPERTAIAARTLIFDSVLPNAARIYAATGGAGADNEATKTIAGFLLVKGVARVLASDLTRNVRVCRGLAVEEVQKLVSPLVAGGWLTPEREFNPTAWAVASTVHEQFTARAAQEAIRRREVRRLIVGDVADGP